MRRLNNMSMQSNLSDIVLTKKNITRPGFANLAFQEVKRFAEGRPIFDRFNNIVDDLVENNLSDPESEDILITKLKEYISTSKPFSLIRLGDGEGNVLFWHYNSLNYPYLASYCMFHILDMMFGDNAPSADQWDNFSEYLVKAILNADFIGLPTRIQHDQQFQNIETLSKPDLKLRGATGVVGVRSSLTHLSAYALSQKNLCQWHIHKQIASALPDLLRYADKISVITCYPELLPTIEKAFSINPGKTVLIPPQALNISSTPEHTHYPTRFEEIINSDLINNVDNGELFLVSAGLLGKYYCSIIKDQGGMAIDIGSLADVWLGLSVRNYHKSSFIAANKI
tara:strand:- start:9441 stop:10460 length:1020 start_codon:yes stop_codon:yes gene_type:complete